MDKEAKIERELHAEIEALREKFPNTQDLYSEVCVLLFFRHGITPTANKLYQLVRKGSMSAPAEALVKFWADLREKSRVRIENPDLPDDLKIAAGEMVGTLWTKAQEMAQNSCDVIRRESHEAVHNAESRMQEAEVAKNVALKELQQANITIEETRLHTRELEQNLVAEAATHLALEGQLASTQQATIEQQKAMDEVRRDFSSELQKLREALKVTEERYLATESRAMLEIDRERTIAGKTQKELELARKFLNEITDSLRSEVRTLQDEIGNLKQRNGHFEGELRAVSASKDRLVAELDQERESVRNLSTRLTTTTSEAEVWRLKTAEIQADIDALSKAKQRKPRKAS